MQFQGPITWCFYWKHRGNRRTVQAVNIYGNENGHQMIRQGHLRTLTNTGIEKREDEDLKCLIYGVYANFIVRATHVENHRFLTGSFPTLGNDVFRYL